MKDEVEDILVSKYKDHKTYLPLDPEADGKYLKR